MKPQAFVIKYGNLYYTTVPPVWGPTFTPHKEKAHPFPSESAARQKATTLSGFTLSVVPL